MTIFYKVTDGRVYATGRNLDEIEAEIKATNFFFEHFHLKGAPREQVLQTRKAYNARFTTDNDELISWAPCHRHGDKSI